MVRLFAAVLGLSLCLLMVSSISPVAFGGDVVEVVNGDTNGDGERDISDATYYLRWQLWTAREVVATPRDRDRYDRVLTLMGFDGDLASTRMIRSGLARPYDGGQRRSWCDA